MICVKGSDAKEGGKKALSKIFYFSENSLKEWSLSKNFSEKYKLGEFVTSRYKL